MTPERWQRIEELYHATLARETPERAAFLAGACAGDEDLRREVESLLNQPATAAGFLDSPAGRVAQVLSVPVAAGESRRIGTYELLSLLGTGGMGEVYRARDTVLGRDVAIKILPQALTSDPDRLARLEREARVLASLNHPNIATLYGVERTVGAPALVIELVEGDTLADRIARGPIALHESLVIARQIVDALDAAHERGIVHRDLKPANVKVRPDGIVKVLDFGLARAVAGDALVEPGLSPTMTAERTHAGLIVGTAAYMSPEQARGQSVDRRTDVWAFGCVLYEMLSGWPAFARETMADTLAAVVGGDPDWSRLPAATPPALTRLLRRCLEKDPRRRLRDVADAGMELDEAAGGAAPLHGLWRAGQVRAAWSLSALGLLVALTAVVYALSPRQEFPPAVRFSVPLPEGWSIFVAPSGLTVGAPTQIAVSPDGRAIAFAAQSDENRVMLWLRSLDSLTVRPLPGTDGATSPFWSPDGRSLAFFADGKLKRIALTGGPAVTVCDAPDNRGGSWGRDNVIVFATSASIVAPVGTGLKKVAASGGVPADATTLADGETAHVAPLFLPDGKHFLYRALRAGEAGAGPIFAASLDSAARTPLVDSTSINVAFSQDHLLFMRGTALMAQAFEPRRLALSGEPVPIADAVETQGLPPTGRFSASDGGLLVYKAIAATESQLVWLDRPGRQISALSDHGIYAAPELSTDGTQVTFERRDPALGTYDIWLVDLTRSVRTRLTSDTANEGTAMWSPGGREVVFQSDRGGPLEMYRKSADGIGREEVVLVDRRNKFPSGWSPDGRFLLYMVDHGGSTGWDLWALPTFGDRKPFAFMENPSNDTQGRFSPDGRWVVYTSGEFGRTEVSVVPFPDAKQRWQISSVGGWWPRWARNGREIFYLALDGTLMVVPVTTDGQRFQAGAARPLFHMRNISRGEWPYDVSSDGQRFLVNVPVESSAPAAMTVVLNWAAGRKP